MFVSLFLTLVAVLLFMGSLTSRMGRAAASLSILSSLLYLVAFFGLDQLTGAGIDESVIYHLGTGLEGAGLAEFTDLIALISVFVIVALGLTVVSFRRAKRPADGPSRTAGMRVVAASLAIAGAVFLNPATADISHLIRTSALANTQPETDATRPVHIAVPERPLRLADQRNLILLYLESVEQTYFDETRFPALMPNLAALAPKALRFEDITQTEGTGWTMGGMVASQCGLPLTGSAGDGVDQFLPEAVCLGDLLSEAGYQLDYLGGAPSEFAGKGTFYTTHGFHQVDGYLTLLARSEDPDYRHYWGLYDDTLLREVNLRLEERAVDAGPFALVTLTLDTHDRNGGTTSKSCDGQPYLDGANPSLDAIHCADRLAAEFIGAFLESPLAANTVLVVMSDHLARPNQAWDLLEAGDRRNLFWAFGAGITPAAIDSPGTTIDAAPTILSLIGADIPSLGYGQNLLEEPSMLRAQEGETESLFWQDRAYLNGLWALPSLEAGVTFDLGNGRIGLGEREVDQLPVVMHIDEQLNVSRFVFEVRGERTLSTYLTGIGYDERFIWVDACDRIAVVQPLTVAPDRNNCVMVGSLGSALTQVIPLEDGFTLSPEQIAAIFGGLSSSLSYYEGRIAGIREAVSFTDQEPVRFVPSNGLAGRVDIRSAGRGTALSWVYDHASDSTTPLDRGFTLLGFNQGEPPTKLGHRDTCGYGGAVVAEGVPQMDNIQATLSDNAPFFGAFAVVLHDSAICFEVAPDLETLFGGSALTSWQQLRSDMPYVAVLAGNGDVSEFLGNKYAALGLEVDAFITPPAQRQLAQLPRVGHAGGIYDGKVYTNSINALDANRSLYDVIELDLMWTRDRQWVCLHDWHSGLIDGDGTQLTFAEFQSRNAASPGLELCTLSTLADWLRKNPGPRILLDPKGDAVELARIIARSYPDLGDRFIPQIFQPQDYAEMKALGFEDVVWTLYNFRGTDDDVLRWVAHMDLYALAMFQDRAEQRLPARARQKTGVLTWIHTVNSVKGLTDALNTGAAEIMTDSMPAGEARHVTVTASGFGAGESYLVGINTTQRTTLQRGVNLISLDDLGNPVVLARYDGCGVLLSGEVPDPQPFVRALAEARIAFETLAVVVHDSAFCGEVTLDPVLAESGLETWSQIGFRQPYIGFLSGEHPPAEHLGEASTQISRVWVLPETD